MALKYEDIKQEFMDTVNNDQTCQKLYAKIRKGDASYKTGSQLAVRIGEDLGKVLKKHAPTMSIDEWDLDDLLPKSLGLDHSMVSTACKQIQEKMNKDAGLGIKPKEPKFDWDRVQGMITELRDHSDTFANIEKSFWDQLCNFSQSIVDQSIRDNAQLLAKAGIKTQVIRQAEFKACEWCRDIAGTYDYADVKETGNDVWRRHENCRCTIDYITERNGSMYRNRVKEGGSDNVNGSTNDDGGQQTSSSRPLHERSYKSYNQTKKVSNSSEYPTIKLSKKEYGHVQHELATHLTAEEKKYPVVIKDIGNYTYIVEVLGDEQYRIIGKDPIE